MNHRLGIALLFFVLLAIVAVGLAPERQAAAEANSGTTTRVSVDSAGVEENSGSTYSAISADGRFVAFYSSSSNLVPGDTNNSQDLFVHDQQTGLTSRVSIDSTGAETDGTYGQSLPAISADGRIVAFETFHYISNIFVHDRQTGATSRVSVSSIGTPGSNSSSHPALSGDGRFVAFMSYANNLVPDDTNQKSDIFVHDRRGGTTRVSIDSAGTQGNGYSESPTISADGRFVAFSSSASNLVPGDTNGDSDIFLHDLQTGTTSRVSVDSAGAEANNGSYYAPALSADGRFVAFSSQASNLVPGDTNGAQDVFVHDRLTGRTRRVSVDANGEQAQGDFSYEYRPAISADGRYVAFKSLAPNLVPGDTNGKEDIFVYDRNTDEPTLVSRHTDKTQGNNRSDAPSISGDGRFVAFNSEATTLVDDDTNNAMDIFVHDRGTDSGSVLGTSSVAPFLKVPFATEGTSNPLANWHLEGRVETWFDHSSPDYQENGTLHLYDPALMSAIEQGEIQNKSCYGSTMGTRYCYEGHDGIDFSPRPWRTHQPVLASAAGNVVAGGIKQNCVADNTCGTLGNYVILYHFQGYFTRYAHLHEVKVTEGQSVNSGDQIGTMGNTGNTTGVSTNEGIHLHFMVYKDVDDNKLFDVRVDKVVDPFGYNWPGGPESDPWVTDRGGARSYDLWLGQAEKRGTATGTEGVEITNPDKTVTVAIPAAMYGNTVITAALKNEPPPGGIMEWLRGVGRWFHLKLVEYTPLDAPGTRTTAASGEPITFVVEYPVALLHHLNENELHLARWDEVGGVWLPLPTIVDKVNKTLTAESMEFGAFDVQAPLICPADVTEPDDNGKAAIELMPGAPSAKRWLDSAMDEDWFSFTATSGVEYRFDFINDPGVKVSLELLDSDGQSTLLTGGSGLVWIAPDDGWYYARVTPASGSLAGCDAGYQLTIISLDSATPTATSTATATSTGTPSATPTTTTTATPTVTGTPLTPTTTPTATPTVTGTPPTATATVSPTSTATQPAPASGEVYLPMVVWTTTIVVNSNADTTADDGQCTLREAIIAANSDAASGAQPGECGAGNGADTITFAANYTITLSSQLQLPVITSEMTITGLGATNTIIQAAPCNPVTTPPGGCIHGHRVLKVASTGYLTLDGVTVRHGRTWHDEQGGNGGSGIYSDGTLTVLNSTISNNRSLRAGGGILSSGTLTVDNSTFAGNSTDLATGGGIASGVGVVTVTNSTFSGNSSEFGGGGIWSGATLIVNDSTFSGNSTPRNGGGIFSYGTLTITNSTISNNSASDVGGGIFSTDDPLTVTNSTISNNSANEGGGIFIDGNLITLARNLIAGNSATGEGSELLNNSGIVTANADNVFSHGGLTSIQAFSNFTPGAGDFNASGDAADVALSAILNTTLGDNGGPTQTLALVAGSPALDIAPGLTCTAAPVNGLDQRGVTRPQGHGCDAGAYEAELSK